MTEQRAVLWDHVGEPSDVRVGHVPIPSPGEERVLLEVTSAGINPYDIKLLTGVATKDAPFPRGIGSDVAGIVRELGANAAYSDGTPIAIGDRVFGWGLNTMREQLIVRAASITRIPDGLSDAIAGALTTPVLAANACWQAGDVTADDVVVVSGASGTIGSLLAQWALRAGATVVGTASEHNLGALTSAGMTGIAYGDGLAARLNALPVRPTVAFDAGGRSASHDLVAAGISPQRIVTLSGDPQPNGVVSADTSIRSTAVLASIAESIAAGEVRFADVTTFSLERAPEAFASAASGSEKIAITPNIH